MTKRLPALRRNRQDDWFCDAPDCTYSFDQFENDLETVWVRPEPGLIEIGKETWQQVLGKAKRRRTTAGALIGCWLNKKLSQTG